MKEIEHISRGLFFNKKGELLFCKNKNKDNKEGYFYLPGGHIEFGEAGEKTLVREMVEETGAEPKELVYCGGFENFFRDGSGEHHEINLVFTGILPESITSREEHIDFEWMSLEKIGAVDLKPPGIQKIIGGWIKDRRMFWLNIDQTDVSL